MANPRLTWEANGFKMCEQIVKILEQSISPTRKRKEMEIFKKFLATKQTSRTKRFSQELYNLRLSIKEELSEFKRYKTQNHTKNDFNLK